VGYRGKQAEQARARELRAESWTLAEIAAELGVSKSSVSLWVRDVPFVPRPRNRGAPTQRPHPLAVAKAAEVAALTEAGLERIGTLSDRDLLIAGVALYAGEGSKTDGAVQFANSDPRMIELFLRFLRSHFVIDEARLRVRLYLHQGLDLARAQAFWVGLTGIPAEQFGKPYRAVPDSSVRNSKHPMGCPSVRYACSSTHRRLMGLVGGLLKSPERNPG
jgi:transcriptional regulator with XRE-family HTH domain